MVNHILLIYSGLMQVDGLINLVLSFSSREVLEVGFSDYMLRIIWRWMERSGRMAPRERVGVLGVASGLQQHTSEVT